MPSILNPVDNLSGSIERITYYNPESGYSVLRLRPEISHHKPLPGLSFDGLVTVVGNLPELTPGEHLRLQGQCEGRVRVAVQKEYNSRILICYRQ